MLINSEFIFKYILLIFINSIYFFYSIILNYLFNIQAILFKLVFFIFSWYNNNIAFVKINIQ